MSTCNTLIEMNQSLVRFAASRFRNRGSGDLEDILQIGHARLPAPEPHLGPAPHRHAHRKVTLSVLEALWPGRTSHAVGRWDVFYALRGADGSR